MTKIFIATPAQDGKVNAQYAVSLANTLRILAGFGIPTEMCISLSGSLLNLERNKLVGLFLKSDATHMLCIDNDLGWPASSVIKMINLEEDFTCGCYPLKSREGFIFRPVFLNNQALTTHPEKQLIEMESVPAGFMLIKRCVFERIMDKFPQLEYKAKTVELKETDGFAFFNTEIYDGRFWGEDYVFSRYVRESGTKIWCYANIEFEHGDVKGCLADALTTDKNKAVEKYT